MIYVGLRYVPKFASMKVKPVTKFDILIAPVAVEGRIESMPLERISVQGKVAAEQDIEWRRMMPQILQFDKAAILRLKII
jgi:hypothetical protein